ncbi:MAG: hypothetical protein ACRCYE_04830 [Sarcina sp.]
MKKENLTLQQVSNTNGKISIVLGSIALIVCIFTNFDMNLVISILSLEGVRRSTKDLSNNYSKYGLIICCIAIAVPIIKALLMVQL